MTDTDKQTEPEVEEQATDEPTDVTIEPLGAQAKVRARPGLKGVTTKTLLGLTAIGLVPALILVALLPSRAGRVRNEGDRAIDAYRKLHETTVALAERVKQSQQLARQFHEKQVTEAVEAYRKTAKRAVGGLEARISPLVTGKDRETIVADEAVSRAIRSARAPLDAAILLEGSTREPLVGRTEDLPELKKLMKEKTDSPALEETGWHWTDLGDSGYVLAYRMKGAELPPAPASAAPVAVPSALDLEELSTQSASLTGNIWLVFFLQIAVALLLGAGLLVWLRARLLAPLRSVTLGARQVLEDPEEADERRFDNAHLVEDLSATLVRLHARMRRLQELDRLSGQSKEHLARLRDVVEDATAGNLAARVAMTDGDFAPVDAAVNRLLTTYAEKFEAFRQAAAHLESSARRLQELSDRLAGGLAPDAGEREPGDPGALGDILSVQLDQLFVSASELAGGLARDDAEPGANHDGDTHREALGAAAACLRGLSLLVQRVTDAGERLTKLRQEAEVLSTNMAIAAEAQSWSQLEKLADDVRTLSRSLAEISETHARELDDFSRSGTELEQAMDRASVSGLACAHRLEAWDNLHASSRAERERLLKQIDVVRPVAGTLGSDVRRLVDRLSDYRRTVTERQETVGQLGESAGALGRTAGELLGLLREVKTAKPAPAAITRNLAEKQQALERAIRDLSELAATQGIESLAPDTHAVLERIRSAAEEAKERILKQQAGNDPESHA